MGTIYTPNVVKVAMRYSTDGLEAYNILNVLCSHPATPADLVSIAGVFQSWWNASYRNQLSNHCVWVGADLTAMDSAGSPFLAYLNSGIATGALSGNAQPPQVTIAVSLRTGLSGRSYRGRFYVAGVLQSEIAGNGLISGTRTAALVVSGNLLRTSLVTAGFQLCVVSLYSGKDAFGKKIPRAAGIATPVNSVVVGARADSQRRRLPVEGRV